MTGGGRTWHGGAFVLVVIVALTAGGAARGREQSTTYPMPRNSTPGLDSRLEQVAQRPTMAHLDGLSTSGGRVRVIVQSQPGTGIAARNAIAAAGGTIEGTAGSLTEALVPPGSLVGLAGNRAVAEVRPPLLHNIDAVDEAVHLTDADAWHTASHTGTGVKVAIIDAGFYGYSALLGTALPASVTTIDHCGGNLAAAPPTGTQHGTAVAELVHQMAPGAQLYLICFDSEVGLAQAEQDVTSNGIKIVNHSVSWFDTSRGDGSGAAGTPDAIVADARAHGVLWVNSAGNEAADHWSGTFTPDPSAPNLNDFASNYPFDDIIIGAGGTACVGLKWDDWPLTSNDYDLGLVDRSGATPTLVAASTDDQSSGPSAPVEELCYTNSTGADREYGIQIARYSAVDSPRLDLFAFGGSVLQLAPPAGSVTEPASSPAALAVGANCWQTKDLEYYSSQGPTIDGRTKPDLTAYDSVSTSTYGAAGPLASDCGATGFTGTSASAPQIAGAAALLLSKTPGLTVSELGAALEASSIARESTGTTAIDDNNETGHGPLWLGPPASLGTFTYDLAGIAYTFDGTAVHQLNGDAAVEPIWSPDGSKVLAMSNSGLELLNPEGTSATLVPGTDVLTHQPAWSPDGSYILYTNATPGIWKKNLSTGIATQLSSGSSDAAPTWSPDGTKIAYVTTNSGSNDVWTMNADGTGKTQITTLGDVSNSPRSLAWSPDSQKLAFVRAPGSGSSVWIVGATGASPHQLTTASYFGASSPFWVSATRLSFIETSIGVDTAIREVNSDGSGDMAVMERPIPYTGYPPQNVTNTATTHPFVLVPVSLSGTAHVGNSLRIGAGSWSATPSLTYSYAWLRCDSTGANCATIGGATGPSYPVANADVGFTIRGQVAVTDGTTPLTSRSFASAVATPARPSASSLPQLTGSATVGGSLQISSRGAWTGATSFTYAWRRCASDGSACSTIGGATGTTYAPTSADAGSTLRATVIGSNTGGSASSSSLPSSAVPGSAGGGGGGGTLPPNMRVQWTSVSNSTPPSGSEVDLVITVDNHGGGNGNNAHLQLTLPTTMKLTGAPYYERGSGCVGTVSIDCNFDYIASGSSTIIRFGVIVSGAGAQSITATSSADGESDPSDNSATVTLQVAAGSGPPPPPPTVHKGRTINGTAGANRLTGTAYADVLNGRAGNDVLSGLGGNDMLNGGTGKDRLVGGTGDDLLNPGVGADTVLGGRGNDVVRARDKTVDVIDCGTGRDTVYADRRDKIAKNCEIVHRA